MTKGAVWKGPVRRIVGETTEVWEDGTSHRYVLLECEHRLGTWGDWIEAARGVRLHERRLAEVLEAGQTNCHQCVGWRTARHQALHQECEALTQELAEAQEMVAAVSARRVALFRRMRDEEGMSLGAIAEVAGLSKARIAALLKGEERGTSS